jgi:hypothetical protein
MVANAASKVGKVFSRLAGSTKNVKSGTKSTFYVATVPSSNISCPLAPPPLPPRPTLYAQALSRIQREASTDSKIAYTEALAKYKASLPLVRERFPRR